MTYHGIPTTPQTASPSSSYSSNPKSSPSHSTNKPQTTTLPSTTTGVTSTSTPSPPTHSHHYPNTSSALHQPPPFIRAILNTFSRYQKERLLFAQTISDLAARESNLETLVSCSVLKQLRPLLNDDGVGVRQHAAMAVARLCGFSETVAREVVLGDEDGLAKGSLLKEVLANDEALKNRLYKRAVANMIKACAKHNAFLANALVTNLNVLPNLVAFMDDLDVSVREAATCAVGYIAKHEEGLAMEAVKAGVVPLLLGCLEDVNPCLRRVAASALGDIAKHGLELAEAVTLGTGSHSTITLLASYLQTPNTSSPTDDLKLKRKICYTLSQLARQAVELAEMVVDGDVFPRVLSGLVEKGDEGLRRQVAVLTSEIAKRSPELGQFMLNTGAVSALSEYLTSLPTTASSSSHALPAISAIGCIASYSDTMALGVIACEVVDPLLRLLEAGEVEGRVKSSVAWALGQMGKHSPDHSKALVDKLVLTKLVQQYHVKAGHDDAVRQQCKTSLKQIIERTLDIQALDSLLQPETPSKLLTYITCQLSRVLPHDIASRRQFVISGGLQRTQDIYHRLITTRASHQLDDEEGVDEDEEDTALLGNIEKINQCYPPEILQYYSPGLSQAVMTKIDRAEGKLGPGGQDVEVLKSAPDVFHGKLESAGARKTGVAGS